MIQGRGSAAQGSSPGTIFLSEYILEINEVSGFLNSLPEFERREVRRFGARCSFRRGQGIFLQGDSHTGVWIIESGRVRTYYVSPAGRELTLAYWTPGHFIGGPEIFGRGRHLWSADAMEDCELLFVSGKSLQRLVREIPNVAIAVIQGLIAKGKCYSALIQMLGTRSASERLRQLVLILADAQGLQEGDRIKIKRSITFEQIAMIVGASRQWVTQSFEKLRVEGLLEVTRNEIIIHDVKALQSFAG